VRVYGIWVGINTQRKLSCGFSDRFKKVNYEYKISKISKKVFFAYFSGPYTLFLGLKNFGKFVRCIWYLVLPSQKLSLYQVTTYGVFQ
jgi:hypothetical protein